MGCLNSVLNCTPNSGFHAEYKIGRELGKGHFATVRICKRLESGEEFAVKMMSKTQMTNPVYLRDEIDILRKVGEHKHCVQLFDVFEDKTRIYLVTELCSGGDLFTRIVETGNYSEKAASQSINQLAQAIAHIHSKGITHRDLKPENILLADQTKSADIKVADFGLSKIRVSRGDVMKTVCGTWAYCAPEVIEQKEYDQKVDNWTVGILMYILLSGYHPFDEYGDLSEPELLEKIVACEFSFEDPVWEDVSDEPKNLIRSLLKFNPNERIGMNEFCKQPWIRGDTATSVSLHSVLERMQSFNESRRCRQESIMSHISTIDQSMGSIGYSERKNPRSKICERPIIMEEQEGEYNHEQSVNMVASTTACLSDEESSTTIDADYCTQRETVLPSDDQVIINDEYATERDTLEAGCENDADLVATT